MTDKPDRIGDGPIEEELFIAMNMLGGAIDTFLNGDGSEPSKVGFVLMAFNFGEGPGRCNYLSNTQREDIIVLLKEQLARFEGQAESEGGTA